MRMTRIQGTCLMALVVLAGVGANAGDTRLLEAIKTGDHAGIVTLLEQHVAVNASQADGTTPLHWAVRGDDLELVRLLLRAGAKPNAANRYGVTPLSLAALNRSPAIVHALLDAGADPNAPLPDGQTILMTAARAGHADVVQALLDFGAYADAREALAGETALMWAAHENHSDAARALVAYGADINARSNALKFSQFKFGDGIVARPTVLPKGGWTPLMYAARQNAIAAAKALADAGADLNLTDPDGTSALVLAIINAHYDLAGVLIDKGADTNVADVSGMPALYAAADMHTLDETVGRPNPKPHSALDSPDIIKALLADGANPNARLKAPILDRVHNDGDANLGEGSTPLMRAAKDADIEVMRLLLDHGADLTLANAKGTTALMYAASRAPGFRGTPNRGSEQDALLAINLCLERGAAINAIDRTGQSAMHLAAAQAEDSIVKLLAAKGANLQLKDQRGRTPLDVALAGGRGRSASAREDKAALLRQLMAGSAPPQASLP